VHIDIVDIARRLQRLELLLFHVPVPDFAKLDAHLARLLNDAQDMDNCDAHGSNAGIESKSKVDFFDISESGMRGVSDYSTSEAFESVADTCMTASFDELCVWELLSDMALHTHIPEPCFLSTEEAFPLHFDTESLVMARLRKQTEAEQVVQDVRQICSCMGTFSRCGNEDDTGPLEADIANALKKFRLDKLTERCLKCDGDHSTESCPYFKMKRGSHSDCWKNVKTDRPT
jgi:hypothetical protein